MTDITYPFRGDLRSHQRRALIEAAVRPGHMWFCDPGAGKTAIAIAEAGLLYLRGKIDAVLIVAPLGVHIQWIEEQFPLWASYQWRGIHNKRTTLQQQKFFAKNQQGLLVGAINFDSVRTANGKAFVDRIFDNNRRVYLVIDESHKIKSPRAARTKATLEIALRSDYRRLLSGTPILKGLEDLWSQLEACTPGLGWEHNPVCFRRNRIDTYGFMGFRQHYCKLAPVPGNPRASRIVGYRNEDELQRRMAPHTTRILSDEFMKGEKPDIIPVHAPMTPKQAAAYRQMKDHLLTILDDKVVTVSIALSQMQKLQQIASGFIYDEEESGYEILGNNKVDGTLNLLEQMSEPVIVWSPYRAQQEMITKAITEDMDRPVYTRDTLDDWKNDPEGILIGNPGSGLGVGMNLQHAAANIYMSNSFSSEARWQSIKRTDRIGQTRQVRVWDLIAPGTVDVTVLKSLNDKEDLSRRTIDELRAML